MGRAETRANISLCGSPCCRGRGLIFLFNPCNEIALVKSTGIFLFAMPFSLFLRTGADCCATRVQVERARKFGVYIISTSNVFMDFAILYAKFDTVGRVPIRLSFGTRNRKLDVTYRSANIQIFIGVLAVLETRVDNFPRG